MRSRDWLPGAVVVVLTAGFGAYLANALRFVDCANEAYSTCSTPGLVQLLIALAGLIPALAMLVLAWRDRGHPGRWFVVTALTYGAWGLYLWQGPGFDA